MRADDDSLGRPRANILIVDDTQANLVAFEAALERLSQRIVRAHSGEEALKAVSEEDFSVVLMDVMMPGLDGFKTAALMRQHERSRHTPIIFVTAADVEPGWVERAYALGAVDLLQKPISSEILLAKVRALVAIHEREVITRQAQAAIAREHAARDAAEEANRQKDEFLATISHELRTPLSAVVGWTELLRAGRLAGPKAAQALDTILRAARNQARLIDDLLDIGRITTGKMILVRRSIRFDELVRGTVEALRPVAAARRVELTVEVEKVSIEGDSERLSQVVWNLVTNSIKFSQPEGGKVSIRLALGIPNCKLTVTDDGVGISADFLPQVFDRFRQADGSPTRVHGGLGLGLSIARYIVEGHSGTIAAQSPGAGRGATFIVSLPSLRARIPTSVNFEPSSHKAETPQIGTVTADRLRGMRILIVEDDPDSRELWATILEQEGASVSLASSVATAMDTFQRQPIDILVSDLGLPDEHGFSLIRRIRKLSKIPAIALTGYAGPEERTNALEAGFDHWMPKPISVHQLVTLLTSLTAR